MRVSSIAVVGLLFTGELIAQDDATMKDLSKFQGSWALVSGERDGKKLSDAETKKTKIVFEREHFVFPDASGIGTSQKGTIKIDPSKNPKWMDSTAEATKGEVSLGIYEFTGDGYRVCFAPPGKPRPSEFSSKPGSGHNLQIWKSDDAEAVVGVYAMLSGEANENKLLEKTVNAASLTIEGDKHVAKVGDEVIIGTHKLNPNRSPKEIDSMDTDGPRKGKTYLGIYKLEKDVFTVYFAAPGKDRPKDFSANTSPGEILHVWKKK